MHISEGVLHAPALISGAALTAAGTGYGLWKLDADRVPQVAVLSSAFFVASLIHVPAGPAVSVHLVLNGLMGLILGWTCFPAILVALFLQAVFFQFGGITTLGINTLNMALPGVFCHILFRRIVIGKSDTTAATAGFLAGALAIALSSLMLSACLLTAGKEFLPAVITQLAAHVWVMVIEGFVTMSAVSFLRKVRPELLSAPRLQEVSGD